MDRDIIEYINKFDEDTKQRFYILHNLIYKSTKKQVLEKLWAKLPTFCVNNQFVRIIPFRNHINIKISSYNFNIEELSEYIKTPKGMLQIYHDQIIPNLELSDILIKVFEG